MNPIPTWVRRLWDVWDLRVLVLLSFTLQLILSIFGNRRKYISSLWIRVLVWSAYLMADWVATVALGKLSDVQGNPEKNNILCVIWAPLLLLHLGGPDTITAYSLEDNQLWLRHLFGLVVQLFVAIYVILMSWKNSWFSFMSLPALVAGIIKYGERTWVLKTVSGNNLKDTLPFGDLPHEYAVRHEPHDYAGVLVLAHFRLEKFMMYLGGERNSESDPYFKGSSTVDDNAVVLDAVEVSMGLLYDLLYTKASRIYSKGGFILRCISFGCTVTVLIGLIFRIRLLKTREEDEIDMAITGVLILGALALEIYAAIVIFSSNWFMLWLIKQGRGKWVTWLNQRFPWLFNKGKSWSKTMGQFGLVGYCLRVTKRGVLGYVNKWNTYGHVTAYPVHPLIYNTLLDYHSKAVSGTGISDLITAKEFDEFRDILEARSGPTAQPDLVTTNEFVKFEQIAGYDPTAQSLEEKIHNLHLATEICYYLENEWDAGGDDQDIPSGWDSSSSSSLSSKEEGKVLSDYIMYLLVMQPSLLPTASINVERALKNPASIVGVGLDVNMALHFRLESAELYDDAADARRRVAEGLKGMGKVKRWEILKLMWWGLLIDVLKFVYGLLSFTHKHVVAGSAINAHFQQLRHGGEFLTFMLLVYMSGSLLANKQMMTPG